MDKIAVIFIKDEHEEGDLYWRLDDKEAPQNFFNYVKANARGNIEIEVDFVTTERWEQIEQATRDLNGL